MYAEGPECGALFWTDGGPYFADVEMAQMLSARAEAGALEAVGGRGPGGLQAFSGTPES